MNLEKGSTLCALRQGTIFTTSEGNLSHAPGEAGQPLEKPGRGFPPVQRQGGGAGFHQVSYNGNCIWRLG